MPTIARSLDAEVRVGLIGYGLAGRDFHAPLIDAVSGMRLAAITTSRTAEVQRDYPGVEVRPVDAVMDAADIDLVVIATPNDSHHGLARQALLAGKAVVIDKPFAVTSAQANEIAALAQTRGLFLSVFHNRRWDGDFLALREILAEGMIGEVAIFESNFDRFRPAPQDRWKERGAGAGVWWDLGPHLLDQALELFGMPKALWADLAIQRPGGQAHDYAHVVLQYDRLRVVLRASMLAYQTGPRFAAQGAAGAVIAGPVDAGFPINLVFDDADGQIDTLRDLPPSRPEHFYEMVRDALRDDGPNPVPVASALAVMRLLELAEESSRLGRTLPVG